MSRPDVKVGEVVEIRSSRGKPYPGTVVKVGPKRVGIKVADMARLTMWRRDTHRADDAYASGVFWTADEVEDERRRKAAWAVLNDAGLMLSMYHHCTVPLDLLEALAAVVTARGAT